MYSDKLTEPCYYVDVVRFTDLTSSITYDEIIQEVTRIVGYDDHRKVLKVRHLLNDFKVKGTSHLTPDQFDSFLERIKLIQ